MYGRVRIALSKAVGHNTAATRIFSLLGFRRSEAVSYWDNAIQATPEEPGSYAESR
jgi:hypothetical protein